MTTLLITNGSNARQQVRNAYTGLKKITFSEKLIKILMSRKL